MASVYSTTSRNRNQHFTEVERDTQTERDRESQRGEFLFFLCYPGRQASESLFPTGELGSSQRGSDRLRSGSLHTILSLIV